LPIEEKIWFLYFMRFLEISINGIESFLFLYQERQNASAKKDDFLSDCFDKSLFKATGWIVVILIICRCWQI